MSNDKKIKVNLKSRPDGFGFIYGQAARGDQVIDINIMPPKSEWDGDLVLKGFEPDDKKYIIVVEGKEIARVEKTDDIAQAVFPALEK